MRVLLHKRINPASFLLMGILDISKDNPHYDEIIDATIDAIGNIGRVDSIQKLVTMENEAGLIKQEAIYALVGIGDTQAIPYLFRSLRTIEIKRKRYSGFDIRSAIENIRFIQRLKEKTKKNEIDISIELFYLFKVVSSTSRLRPFRP